MSEQMLPEGWIETTMNDIAIVVGGGTPKASDSSNFCEPPEGISWLTPADLSGYKKSTISHGKRDITVKGYESSSAKKMPKGSVLFSSRAPIGYTVIAENEITTNQGFKSFVIDKNIDSKFLYFYLRSIKHIAEANGTGTTFKELSGAAAKKLPALIPPLNEQKRIADKLDELLAQVDTIKARVDAIPAILNRFRQSVLAAAVSGRLTEEWRNKNNPCEWNKKALGDIVKLINGDRGKNYPNQKEYVNTGIPFINTGHIEPDGSLSIERMNYITREKFNSLGSGKVKPNDLVYCLRGATMGKTAKILQFDEGAIASSLVIVRPSDEIITHFVYIFLVSPQGKDRT